MASQVELKTVDFKMQGIEIRSVEQLDNALHIVVRKTHVWLLTLHDLRPETRRSCRFLYGFIACEFCPRTDTVLA